MAEIPEKYKESHFRSTLRLFPLVVGVSAFVVLILTACSRPPDLEGEKAAVEQTLREIIAADNRGDLEAIVNLYAPDAVLIPPDENPVTGREAIRRRYSDGFSQFSMEVSFDSAETVLAGEWAFNRGKTTGTLIWLDGRPPTPLNDDYLMILEKSPRSGWQIHRLIWNGGGD